MADNRFTAIIRETVEDAAKNGGPSGPKIVGDDVSFRVRTQVTETSYRWVEHSIPSRELHHLMDHTGFPVETILALLRAQIAMPGEFMWQDAARTACEEAAA